MTTEIDATRLWQTILETGRIGATERGGVCRLTLSDEDRRVRDWFVEACEREGCRVTVDEMGNLFARRRQDVSDRLRFREPDRLR